MNNKSILIITRFVQGGMKTHLEVLIRGLIRENYRVCLVTPLNNFNLPPQVKVYVLAISEIPCNRSSLSVILRLKQLIIENEFWIIHTHGYAAGIIGRLAAILAGKKEIFHTVHNFFPQVSPLLTYGGVFAEKQLARHTKKIITVSEQLRAAHIDKGINPDKLITIYNGIDTARFQKKDKNKARVLLGLSEHDHVIGTVSRLIPSKGIDILLRTLAQLNETLQVSGIIIGDGPEKTKLENLANKLGLKDNALFLGHCEDISELLSALDVFVLPSRQEGFGLTLIESQWLGIPVIASDTGGIREIVQHNFNGLLFNPEEVKELNKNIIALLMNREFRNEIAQNGLRSVRMRFSADRMIEETLKLYNDY